MRWHSNCRPRLAYSCLTVHFLGFPLGVAPSHLHSDSIRNSLLCGSCSRWELGWISSLDQVVVLILFMMSHLSFLLLPISLPHEPGLFILSGVHTIFRSNILLAISRYHIALPVKVAGIELEAVNPMSVDLQCLLRQRLPMKLPVGQQHGYQEEFADHLDSSKLYLPLEHAFVTWMDNDIAGGGENGIIGRNDGLLKIVKIVGGLTFFERDNQQSSTQGTTRQDATLGLGRVPVVHVEEKRWDVALAAEDLQSKLHWIPNWSKLPFIFGIAISASELQIWKLTPGTTKAVQLFATALNSPQERMNSVVAVTHCGRVLRYYREQGLVLAGSGLAFNVWHERDQNKSVKFSNEAVYVWYKDRATFDNMIAFYQANAQVENLERMVSFRKKDGVLCLQPLGVSCVPESAADLVDALRCVLTCLKGLHTNGYYHTDLRWTNIVWVRKGNWCLVDCTNFVRSNAPKKELLDATNRCRNVDRLDDSPWSVKHELFQVGRLIEEVIARFTDENFVTWKTKCLEGVLGSAEELLQAVSMTLSS